MSCSCTRLTVRPADTPPGISNATGVVVEGPSAARDTTRRHVSITYADEAKTQQVINIGSTADFPAGSCKDISVLESKTVLVGRTVAGTLFATGPRCTHYGAPLKNGILSGHRIICPWHAACFNVHTGDIEDGPGLDALTTFQIREQDNNVLLTVPVDAESLAARRVPACLAGSPSSDHYVVLGGGAASLAAIETLRQQGFQGDITLVSGEPHLPYDRIKLSKAFPTPGVAALFLRNEDFFATNRVKVLPGVQAEAVDTFGKTVQTSAGVLNYTKLLCATGGKARRFVAPESFVLPGADLGNVFTIRKYEDAKQLDTVAASLDPSTASLVIIGAGFIGTEVANAFSTKWRNITIIESENVPFARTLGAEIGLIMQRLLQAKGIHFALSSRVRAIEGERGIVERVRVEINGKEQELPANVVIIGAGIVLSTSYMSTASGVTLDPRDGSVHADEFLQAAPDVFVAGDIARFPLWLAPDAGPVRIEHWDVALDTGRVAARNMLGQRVPYRVVPFFWSAQPVSVRYAGHCPKADDIIITGSPAEHKVVAFYVAGGAVRAVVAVNRDPAGVAAHAAFTAGTMPTPEAIRAAADPYALLLQAAREVSSTYVPPATSS